MGQLYTLLAVYKLNWHFALTSCLGNREVDEDDEAAPWKEQEHWESDQIKKASMHVGAKDRKGSAQEYDFVFDDQIDFIKDLALAGDVVRYSIKTPLQVVLHLGGTDLDSPQA